MGSAQVEDQLCCDQRTRRAQLLDIHNKLGVRCYTHALSLRDLPASPQLD
jgi:hypothetical protein